MQIALLGATGQTGQLLLNQALAAGHTVTALVRTPSKVTVQSANLKLVQGDVLQVDDVTKALAGQDIVISVIGARTLKPDTICTDSARNVLAAMKTQQVNRFICISGAGLHDNAGFIIQDVVCPLTLKNVYADAVSQDQLIMHSGVDWTIVRPYRLTKGTEPTHYQVADKPFHSPIVLRWTSRADVADFMVHEAENSAYQQKIAFVSSGGF